MHHNEPLIRVHQLKRNCPICGKKDWCSLNSKLVVCMRVPSDKPAKGEGWIHYLNLKEPVEYKPMLTTQTKVSKASKEKCNRIYQSLLNMLPLYDHHYADLVKRGLSDIQIQRHGFKSLPTRGRHKICRALMDMGYNLEGVPGFFINKGKYGEYWTFSGAPGYLVPVKQDFKIFGFQVRMDNPVRNSKYTWFSSLNKKGGAGSGAPFHIAVPGVINTQVDFLITEGPTKAIIAAEKLHVPTFGVAGVGNCGDLINYLAKKGCKTGVIGYDMDILTNPNVLYHTVNLYGKLVKAGIYSFMAFWQGDKGIDDYLVRTGKQPQIVPASKLLIRLLTRAINDRELLKKHPRYISYFEKVLTSIRPLEFGSETSDCGRRSYKY